MSAVLAIIPARSGSKGIPNKNFTPLDGITPIDRVCRVAALAGISEFVVSTDAEWSAAFFTETCPEETRLALLGTIGRWQKRPAELAQDDTPMIDVVRHSLGQIAGPPDQPIVLLQPTQPLREPKHITQALALLTPEVDSVVSVVEAESPHKLHSIEDGWLYTWNAIYAVERRQDAKPAWRRDGTCYAFWRRTVEQFGSIYGDKVVPLIIDPRETCPLDTPADWAEAERRLRARQARPDVRIRLS